MDERWMNDEWTMDERWMNDEWTMNERRMNEGWTMISHLSSILDFTILPFGFLSGIDKYSANPVGIKYW